MILRVQALRIDFIRCNLLPIQTSIPCALFFSKEALGHLDPSLIRVGTGPLVTFIKGIPFISHPLYASGVDQLFLDIVRPHLQIAIAVESSTELKALSWSIQFINAKALYRCADGSLNSSAWYELRTIGPLAT